MLITGVIYSCWIRKKNSQKIAGSPMHFSLMNHYTNNTGSFQQRLFSKIVISFISSVEYLLFPSASMLTLLCHFYNLTKVRPLFYHIGYDNSPLVIVFSNIFVDQSNQLVSNNKLKNTALHLKHVIEWSKSWHNMQIQRSIKIHLNTIFSLYNFIFSLFYGNLAKIGWFFIVEEIFSELVMNGLFSKDVDL